MGGLARRCRWTYCTMVRRLARHLPASRSSPASSPRTRSSALRSAAGIWLLPVGTAGRLMTAFYMFRMFFLAFFGTARIRASRCAMATPGTTMALRCRPGGAHVLVGLLLGVPLEGGVIHSGRGSASSASWRPSSPGVDRRRRRPRSSCAASAACCCWSARRSASGHCARPCWYVARQGAGGSRRSDRIRLDGQRGTGTASTSSTRPSSPAAASRGGTAVAGRRGRHRRRGQRRRLRWRAARRPARQAATGCVANYGLGMAAALVLVLGPCLVWR